MEQQLLTNPLGYLTKKDWVRVGDPKAVPAVMSRVIAERVSLLRVRGFDEQTYRWIITILLAKVLQKTGKWPKYKTIYGWLQDFKRDYTTLKTPYPFDLLAKYPPSPDLLSQDMFAHAYPDPDDPPITMEIEHFRTLGEQHVPLRKNSHLIIRENEAEQRLSMQSFGMPGMPGMAGSTPQMQHQFAAWLRMQQAEHTPIPDTNYFGAAAPTRQSSSSPPIVAATSP